MYDVIVVGAGPAGASCAIYCRRAGLKVLVLHNNKSSLLLAERIENYYGIESVAGKELYIAGIKQLKQLGCEVKEETVLEIFPLGEKLKVVTEKNSYESRFLVLAIGSERKEMDIENAEKFVGRGLSFCVTCDAWFFKGKKVAVYGKCKEAVESAARYLKGLAREVVVVEKRIKRVEGRDRLERIVLENGEVVEVDGLFIVEELSASKLAHTLRVEVERGVIKTSEVKETSIKNLFAIGDCANTYKQITVAVGEGAIAGMEIVRRVKEDMKRF